MGMSNSGCCCSTGILCRDCEYDTRICCLKLENSAWNMYAILLNPLALEFYSGDTCGGPRPLPTANTNMCGSVESLWFLSAGAGDPAEPARPGWDNTPHDCMPNILISWGRGPDCTTVVMGISVAWRGQSRSTTLLLEPDWYLSTHTFTDNLYAAMHAGSPSFWPTITPTPEFTLSVCPDEYVEFPAPEGRVYIKSDSQEYNSESEEWETYAYGGGVNNPITAYGGLLCGRMCVQENRNYSHYLMWWYNIYRDEVFIEWSIGVAGYHHLFAVDYMDGEWPDNLPEPYSLVEGYPPYPRLVLSRVEECVSGSGESGPPPPTCGLRRLCLMLSVPNTGEIDYSVDPITLFYNLVWDDDTQQYELAPTAVPNSKPYTIEVTLVEDAGSLPGGSPVGSRAWILHVIIKESPSGTVVLDHTEVLVIDCTAAWSRETLLSVPISPTESWLLKIATRCPDPPEPPPCDPLCWPECVLCPTPLSMSLVVTQDPSCCLHGSYGLTYDSGNNWFTLTSAPVGGPSGVCGKITAFKMTCSDSTHVTLAITYEDVNGSTISSTTTVSANCTGGDFETDTVTVISGLFAPGLCEGGFGLGAKFRVVGI